MKGFTLIELMITIVIIGILSAVAIPTYSNYIAKARMAEVITAVGPAETEATEYAISNAGFSGFNDSLIETTTASTYINAITVSGTPGNSVTLQIMVANSLVGGNGEALDFVGNYSNNGVTWVCEVPSSSTRLSKISPSSCQRV